jgi:virginiamycin B lyase
MRGIGLILASAACAALCAVAVSACGKSYAITGTPFPSPSLAPTFPAGVVIEYPVPSANATPFGITSGSDGNLWFTELSTNNIGRITPSGAIVEFPIPTANSGPLDISAGSGNSNLWFDEDSASKIGSITTSGAFAEFVTPTANAGPAGLAPDTLGNLWFAEFNVGRIAKITTGGVITEYPISYSSSEPDSVAVTPDNTVWYLDFFNNAVGHLTFPGGTPTFIEYPIPTAGNGPEDIIVGPDHNLWFTEFGNLSVGQTSRIGEFNVSGGTITEFLVPTQSIVAGAFGLAVGSDHNIWFAENIAGQIARLKLSGPTITEWGVPNPGTTAIHVTNGPDNALWFTDGTLVAGSGVGTNQIGRVNISALPAVGIRKQYVVRTETYKTLPTPINGPRLVARIK